MQKFAPVFCTITVFTAVLAMLLANNAFAQSPAVNRASETAALGGQPLRLNVDALSGHQVHVMPTYKQVKELADIGYQHNGGTPPLLYNGGPVMTSPTVYLIYWIPPHLQDGTATSMSTSYQNIQTTMIREYFGHSLDNNNTQYYQNSPKAYIKNTGRLGGTYVDKALYPGSDCFDPATTLTNGNNCISDTDLQNEIDKVMALKHWTGGVNNLFMVFTSSNEGQCAVSDSDCSYANYCAYHSFFVNGSQDVLYANQPYGDVTVCQAAGAPSPNGFREADAEATAAAHELTESITDPLINAWLDSSGFEIGDECAYYYGVPLWDGGLANEQWDGHSFYIQTMYSNLTQNYSLTDSNFTGCFNTGPEL